MKRTSCWLSLAACFIMSLTACAAPTATVTTVTTATQVSTFVFTTTPTPSITTKTPAMTTPATTPAVKTATMEVTIFPPVNTVPPTQTFSLPTVTATLKPTVTTLLPTATASVPPTSVVIKTGWLLPDLEVIDPFQLFIMRDPSTGHRWLFFDTTVINTGTGPLEMRGAYDEATGKTRAIQRIYTGPDTYEDRIAGYFIYHPLHDHWHFEGFSIFELFLPTAGRSSPPATSSPSA